MVQIVFSSLLAIIFGLLLIPMLIFTICHCSLICKTLCLILKVYRLFANYIENEYNSSNNSKKNEENNANHVVVFRPEGQNIINSNNILSSP